MSMSLYLLLSLTIQGFFNQQRTIHAKLLSFGANNLDWIKALIKINNYD